MDYFTGRDFSFFNILCFLFFLPICLNFLVIIIGNVLQCYQYVSPDVVSPDVVRSDITVEADESVMTAMQAELESVKKQLSKLKTKKNKSKKDDKNKTMMQEAAIALNKLGVQKSRANSIVKNLCNDRVYASSEELLQDAIVYIG